MVRNSPCDPRIAGNRKGSWIAAVMRSPPIRDSEAGASIQVMGCPWCAAIEAGVRAIDRSTDRGASIRPVGVAGFVSGIGLTGSRGPGTGPGPGTGLNAQGRHEGPADLPGPHPRMLQVLLGLPSPAARDQQESA